MKKIYPVKAENLQVIDIRPGYSVIFRDFDHVMKLDKKGLIPLFHKLIREIDGITPLKDMKEKLSSSINGDILDGLVDILSDHGFIEIYECPLIKSQRFDFKEFKDDVLSPTPKYPDLQLDILKGKKFLVYLDDMTALTISKVLSEIDGTEVIVFIKYRFDFFNQLEKIDFIRFFKSKGIKYFISNQKIFPPFKMSEVDIAFNSPETWNIIIEEGIISHTGIPPDVNKDVSFLFSFTNWGGNAIIFQPLNIKQRNIYSHFLVYFFSSLKNGKTWKEIITRITDKEKSERIWKSFTVSESGKANVLDIYPIEYSKDIPFKLPPTKYNRKVFIQEVLRKLILYFKRNRQFPLHNVGEVSIIPKESKNVEKIYFSVPYEEYTHTYVARNPFKLVIGLTPRKIEYPIPDLPRDIAKSTLLNKYVGTIERINIEPPLSKNLPFYYATAYTRNTSLFTGRKSINVGAGCSYNSEDASNSAIGEALERYCASFIFREDPIYIKDGQYSSCRYYKNGSFNSLLETECSPDCFSLFSDKQYGKRGFPYIPFDKDTDIMWVPGRRLMNNTNNIDYRNKIYENTFRYDREIKNDEISSFASLRTANSRYDKKINSCSTKAWDVILPAPFVFLPYYANIDRQSYCPRKTKLRISPYSSVGLGCGESLEEAILAGLYEVIERHALALFWLRRDIKPEVSLKYIREKLKEREIAFILDPSVNYRILNLTGDFNIPIYYGFSIEDWKGKKVLASGSACRIDPVDAVVKTISEISHNRIYLRKILSEDKDYSYMYNWNNIRSYRDHALFYNLFPGMFSYLDFFYKGGTDNDILNNIYMEKDNTVQNSVNEKAERILSYITDVMEKRGKHIYYSILTTSNVETAGYHVVRILIPGFIYPSPVFGQEFLGCPDLYSTGLTEDELNPLPHLCIGDKPEK